MTITLTLEALEAASFAPFGDVIEASDRSTHFAINGGTTERYHDLAQLEPGHDGRVIVSIFRGLPRSLPFKVETMERHPKASQAFIPTTGEPYLVVVAPAGGAPTAADLRLFLAQGTQGVNYAPGVWHHPLLALNTVSDFIVIDRKGPGENTDVVQLADHAMIAGLAQR